MSESAAPSSFCRAPALGVVSDLIDATYRPVGLLSSYIKAPISLPMESGGQWPPRVTPPCPPVACPSCAGAFRRELLLAPGAPAVQIFIRAMRAFDRGQLILEIRRRFAARCCGGDRDD